MCYMNSSMVEKKTYLTLFSLWEVIGWSIVHVV